MAIAKMGECVWIATLDGTSTNAVAARTGVTARDLLSGHDGGEPVSIEPIDITPQNWQWWYSEDPPLLTAIANGTVTWTVSLYDAYGMVDAIVDFPRTTDAVYVRSEPNPLTEVADAMERLVGMVLGWIAQWYVSRADPHTGARHMLDPANLDARLALNAMPTLYNALAKAAAPFYTTPTPYSPAQLDAYNNVVHAISSQVTAAIEQATQWPRVVQRLLDAGYDPLSLYSDRNTVPFSHVRGIQERADHARQRASESITLSMFRDAYRHGGIRPLTAWVEPAILSDFFDRMLDIYRRSGKLGASAIERQQNEQGLGYSLPPGGVPVVLTDKRASRRVH